MRDHDRLHDSDYHEAAKTSTARHLSPKAVATIQGNIDVHAQRSLEHKAGEAQTAARAAIKDIDPHTYYMDARRKSSEAAALATAGAGARNLDQLCRDNPNLHLKGNNYPIYDLISPSEVASIKTYWAGDGALTPEAVNRYVRAFNRMLGSNRQPNALASDAGNLIAVCSNSTIEHPSDLKLHSPTEVGKYLRDKSVLRIPDDHVDPVRDELARRMQQFPDNYYLPQSVSEDSIREVVAARVKGIGVDSTYLRELLGR
jgi:hypothetical protein